MKKTSRKSLSTSSVVKMACFSVKSPWLKVAFMSKTKTTMARTLRAMRFAPVFGVPGTGKQWVQPVLVDDLAACVALALSGRGRNQIYEIGGPDLMTFDQLMHAIMDASARRSIVLDGFLKTEKEPPQVEHPGTRTTPREVEVIRLLAKGKMNKEIAAQLGITVRTVETHRAKIMLKLGLHSLAELIHYAIRQGLCTEIVSASSAKSA